MSTMPLLPLLFTCTLQEEELEVVRTLQEEVERLREALSQEQESKEEGLHMKDGEIAMLKAKVRYNYNSYDRLQ